MLGEDEGPSVLEEHFCLKVRNEKVEDAEKEDERKLTVLKKIKRYRFI